MKRAERIELSARFLAACGVEVTQREEYGGVWWMYGDIAEGGGDRVPDLTAEHELGRVVRLVRERWADGLSFACSNEGCWSEAGPSTEQFDDDNPNVALMRAAIAAAEAEDA